MQSPLKVKRQLLLYKLMDQPINFGIAYIADISNTLEAAGRHLSKNYAYVRSYSTSGSQALRHP
ncbi:MAG TPA: hypothetical protein VE818_09730 [Nitrososphaeraceae archaeon]|nr:hypothetical protein [Nitrososphaeraceae archaeon]